MKIFEKLASAALSLLSKVGNAINQVPSEAENKNIKHSPLFMSEPPESKTKPIQQKSGKPDSKRKGRRPVETQTFNHPRKDYHAPS